MLPPYLDPSSDYFHGFCTEVGKKEGQFRIINATSFINYQFFALGSWELRGKQQWQILKKHQETYQLFLECKLSTDLVDEYF